MTEPRPSDAYAVTRSVEYDAAKMSDLEASFLFHWRALAAPRGYPWPVPEYEFNEMRKWRFDFAWPDHRLAVECEGGIFTGQAHGSVTGILRDIEKYNAAALCGWRVYRVTPPMLEDDPAGTIEEIAGALVDERGWFREVAG